MHFNNSKKALLENMAENLIDLAETLSMKFSTKVFIYSNLFFFSALVACDFSRVTIRDCTVDARELKVVSEGLETLGGIAVEGLRGKRADLCNESEYASISLSDEILKVGLAIKFYESTREGWDSLPPCDRLSQNPHEMKDEL